MGEKIENILTELENNNPNLQQSEIYNYFCKLEQDYKKNIIESISDEGGILFKQGDKILTHTKEISKYVMRFPKQSLSSDMDWIKEVKKYNFLVLWISADDLHDDDLIDLNNYIMDKTKVTVQSSSIQI